VGTLPPLERAAVVLRYRDGLSYQDIAAKLNKTATHVGVLLHQALGRLRQDAALKEGVANA
jgi:RNA polymerase sigma factor (sigma-70 family)